MIIRNMEYVLDKRAIKKLQLEGGEWALPKDAASDYGYDQLHWCDGTIFDNIKKLNDHMSDKMAMKIDFRSASNLAAEKD